jgi:flagellar hook-basal body complex protein FliE
MPVDPTLAVNGPEWQIALEDPAPGAGAAPAGESFGSMLAGQIEQLSALQRDASVASRSLADGTATDPSSVVMSIERARLAMQLASQIRTKGVDAAQDVFRTQV